MPHLPGGDEPGEGGTTGLWPHLPQKLHIQLAQAQGVPVPREISPACAHRETAANISERATAQLAADVVVEPYASHAVCLVAWLR